MSSLETSQSQSKSDKKKKPSKRQRSLQKKKTAADKAQKAKQKRLAQKEKKNTLKEKKEPSSDVTVPTRDAQNSNKNVKNGIVNNNGTAQTSAKLKRKSTKSTKKSAKRRKGVTTHSTPDEPAIEPDKNWKELSKKLGIKSDSKKSTSASKIDSKSPAETELAKDKEVWFDDVDELFIEKPVEESEDKTSDDLSTKLVTKTTRTGLTKCLAMDCEMVGVGPSGTDSVLARISVVNQYGHCVYDKFVKPKEEVTDYRTWVSGVRPEDLEQAEELETVQKEVNEMFKGRILVGHAISNDEKVLFMNHPKKFIRDTQKYHGFRQLVGGRRPGLKMLTEKVLGVKIQTGEHSSVQDAQATMRLYTMVRDKWEKKLREKRLLNRHLRKKMASKVKTKKGE